MKNKSASKACYAQPRACRGDSMQFKSELQAFSQATLFKVQPSGPVCDKPCISHLCTSR